MALSLAHWQPWEAIDHTTSCVEAIYIIQMNRGLHVFKNNNYKGKLDKETQRKQTTHIKKLNVHVKKLDITKTRYICHVN